MARLSLALAALAAALLVAAALTSAELGPLSVSPAAAVSEVGPGVPLARSHEAPSVVADRDRPDLLYMSHVELLSGACRFSVSVDRGATWASETAPSHRPHTGNCGLGASQPHNLRTDLAQGPDGVLYYAFQGNDPGAGGTRSVLLARSDDGGRSWTTSLVYGGPVAVEPTEIEVNFQAHVAVDPDRPQRVYVSWRRSYPALEEPSHLGRLTRSYLAVSDDGGKGFGPARMLFDRTTGSDGPRMIVAGGVLAAFYVDTTPPLATPDPSPTPPGVEVSVAISSDGGRTWERVVIAEAPSASDPDPVYDPERRRFHAVWHDNRDGDLDAYHAWSDDGRSWSEARRLNDDPLESRVGQHYPQASISPGGRVDVAWYDWRDDPFPTPFLANGAALGLFSNRGKMAAVYFTSSGDGGISWIRNVRVSDVPIDRTLGTWGPPFDVMAPVAIVSTRHGATVAWSDTRNATSATNSQDVYAATVHLPSLSGQSVTSTESGLAGLMIGAGGAMWGAVALLRRRPGTPGRAGAGRPAVPEPVLPRRRSGVPPSAPSAPRRRRAPVAPAR